ncbi:MAG: hypothetical protein A3E83_08290 [Gammaproteobacteria bacterium RIFCSPHIGHO2_12_FULL_41_20]|nr:MAG: hypothetical protein A3E83_08290 [Gammaproteobacteria bacterium RIFCSPHIGHO2_12_FULL_41_20]
MTILQTFADMIGIIGVVLTLTAYFLLNINRLHSTQVSYLLLNFLGSTLVLVSLYFHWNLASVMIEFCWVLISLVGLYRIFMGKSIRNSVKARDVL